MSNTAENCIDNIFKVLENYFNFYRDLNEDK